MKTKRIEQGQDVGKDELCQLFGVTNVKVDNWLRAGCPYRKEGGKGLKWLLNTADVFRWAMGRQREVAAPDPNAIVTEEGKRRYTLATARLKELELAEREGSLVEATKVQAVLQDELAAVRTRLMVIPARLAQRISVEPNPSRCEAMIKEEVRLALAELAVDNAR